MLIRIIFIVGILVSYSSFAGVGDRGGGTDTKPAIVR